MQSKHMLHHIVIPVTVASIPSLRSQESSSEEMTLGLISEGRVGTECTWWWTFVPFSVWGNMRVPVALYSHQHLGLSGFLVLVIVVNVLLYLITFNLHFSEKSWGWVSFHVYQLFGYPPLWRAYVFALFFYIEFFVFSLLTCRSSFCILDESFVGYHYCRYLLPINGLPFHFNGIFLRNRSS